MYIYLLILFVIVVALSLQEDFFNERTKKIMLACITTIMVLVAAFKPVGLVADSEAYENMFYNNDNQLIEIATEPTFIYLSRIVISLGGGISCIFFIYAIISLYIKMMTFNKMMPYIFTSLIIYIPVYYELHDLVQIRASVAGAFILLSIYFFNNKKYLNTTLAFIGGILFHYSSLAFIIFYIANLIRNDKITKYALALITPLSFLFYIAHKDLFNLIPSSIVEGKLDFYKNAAETGTGWDEMLSPLKNLYFLVKVALFYLYLYFYEYLSEKNRYFKNIMLAEAGSFFWLLTMATIPVIATRVSDLYGIVDAVFFTYILYIIKQKLAARIFIAFIGFYMFIYNILFAGYFD